MTYSPYLAVIEGVGVVAVPGVLLVAVEAVIVRSAEQKYYQLSYILSEKMFTITCPVSQQR